MPLNADGNVSLSRRYKSTFKENRDDDDDDGGRNGNYEEDQEEEAEKESGPVRYPKEKSSSRLSSSPNEVICPRRVLPSSFK